MIDKGCADMFLGSSKLPTCYVIQFRAPASAQTPSGDSIA